MGTRGLAEYFAIKYAGYEDFSSEPADTSPADTSFGKPINGIKARMLKDKIILAYDRIFEGLAQLPIYNQLNTELANEFYWKVFQDLISNLAATIEGLSLKDAFSFSVKLIDALNQLRNGISRSTIEREKMTQMEAGIKNMQDYIWKESKRFLNIHTLKDTVIDTPELKGIVNTVVPTWDYGPGKNPTHAPIKPAKPESAGRLMKRMEEESLKTDIKKRLGPYASEQEVNDEFDRIKKEEQKAKRQEIVKKHNSGLAGKEKYKLR